MEHHTIGYLAWFIVIGGVAGSLAWIIVRGRGFGIIADISVGVIGGIVGGLAAGMIGLPANIAAFLLALFGAMVLISLTRLVVKIKT